jgi:hypothetical protein
MGSSKFERFALNQKLDQVMALLSLICMLFWCQNGFTKASDLALVSVISPIYSTERSSEESVDLSHFFSKNAQYVNWIFSGVVSTEKGDQYGYFFQMQRNGDILKSNVALFDAQSKIVIFQDENQTPYDHNFPYRWQIGRSFLSFNPINASWVFGIKYPDKKGFNFKIDMLEQTDHQPLEEILRPGVSVFINQTHSLNGHIHIDEKHEEFVMAKHAWFRQIAMDTIDGSSHSISGLLCHFDDNSGFYSMKLPESDALRGAIASRFDAQGKSEAMSQFIHVKQLSEGSWDIYIPSPNRHLVLSESIQRNAMIAGFVKYDEVSGFCLLSDEKIG